MKTFLAGIGACFLIAAAVGATDIADFHVYFGPDADAWHVKMAERAR